MERDRNRAKAAVKLGNEEREEQRATLTVQEAARKLGIGKNQVYAAARRGELPVLRIGGRILVCREALDDMLRRPRIVA